MKKAWYAIPLWGRKLIQYAVVAVFWVSVWVIAAACVGNSLLLPTPWKVLSRLGQLSCQWDFWRTLLTSLGRIMGGVAIALVFGVLMAIATHFVPFLYTLFYPMITIIRSAPIASFLFLLYLWLNRDLLPIIIAILMVLPVVWANLHEALGAVDKSLLEMARVYGFSPWKKVKYIYYPSVLPAFMASCRSSMGLAWKAGVAAEAILVPSISIGKMLYENKINLETTDLFAWTLTVILLSLILELLLLGLVRLVSKHHGKGKNIGEEVAYASSSDL